MIPRARGRSGVRNPPKMEDFKSLIRQFETLQEEIHIRVVHGGRDESEDEAEDDEPFIEVHD